MLYLSFFEGFGLPVLEAMSCGTPVICSNTSCFPEIVEELDVMVDPKDVKGVEDKIERIILDGQYSLNPSLIFNCPFLLLSSTLRFSFVALCTTNFSRF